MKLFANENLYEPLIDFLKSLGHDVSSIREEGLSGISDDTVYKMACKERRVIITMDKDFARMFRFPPEGCGGIIVVKIYKRTVEETLQIFKNHFPLLKPDDIKDKLVIITPEGIRIRRMKQ